jgi:MOSC domain-containing protein YiiM
MAHLRREEIEQRLRALAQAPAREGRVGLLVRRLPNEGRETPEMVALGVDDGVVGDRWGLGRSPKLDAQVTLMREDVARLLCDGADPALLGDNLFATIDTSAANLPAGTRVLVGDAVCEVTPKPHTGCHKFAARVGQEALDVTRDPVWKDQQLRGVHLRVLVSGRVRRGDPIRVMR